jgi:hypothetical protein
MQISLTALTIAAITACAAFLSACVGAVVSFKANERKIRSQTISVSRQKWMDGMENIVAELMSLLLVVAILKRQIKDNDTLAAVASDRALLDKIEQLALAKIKIRLMINPEKADHRILYETIDATYNYVVSLDHLDVIDRLRVDVEGIADQVSAIVRYEWSRVKRGE